METSNEQCSQKWHHRTAVVALMLLLLLLLELLQRLNFPESWLIHYHIPSPFSFKINKSSIKLSVFRDNKIVHETWLWWWMPEKNGAASTVLQGGVGRLKTISHSLMIMKPLRTQQHNVSIRVKLSLYLHNNNILFKSVRRKLMMILLWMTTTGKIQSELKVCPL